ncbi:MAG: nucleotide sugar dehydrogenase [Planctomycetota bacterium]
MQNEMTTPQRVCFVGLGKLGAPIAAATAVAGVEVVAVDRDVEKVAAVNRGEAAVEEPGLEALMERVGGAGGRLRATTEVAEAVGGGGGAEMTFLIVPTPSGEDGGFVLDAVLAAVREVGEALRMSRRPHVVVVTSTVMPGSTAGPIREALESASGRLVGGEDGLGLCYSPEFIALGSVIKDYLTPDLVLIGESDAAAGDALEAFSRRVTLNAPPVRRMNLVNAELTKLTLNTFVTTKLTFANTVAAVCEGLPGADVDVVTGAIGLDSRVGGKCLKGATGYGGPCFPRDNRALRALGRSVGADVRLPGAVDAVNDGVVDRLVGMVEGVSGGDAPVLVLGLSYKPGTGVVEQSQGLMVAERLAEAGRRVVVHDPMGMDAARGVLGDAVGYEGDWRAAVEEVSGAGGTVVLAMPWEQYLEVGSVMRGGVLVDAWRGVDVSGLAEGVGYVAVGRGAVAGDSRKAEAA